MQREAARTPYAGRLHWICTRPATICEPRLAIAVQAPGGLVQPTAIVPEVEMQPQTQAGLHLLHGSATTPALHSGPMLMALPGIVGDRYRAQQASVAAEQDPHATVFEGERYDWN